MIERKKMIRWLTWCCFVLGVIVFAMCFTVSAEAKMTEISSNSSSVKTGNYYVSWSCTVKNESSSNKVVYRNTLYRSTSKNGKKTKLVSTGKRVQFVVSDGTYLYFDSGEILHSDYKGQVKLKIWKLRISDGSQKSFMVLSIKDRQKATGWGGPGYSISQSAYDIIYNKIYGNYVYFYPGYWTGREAIGPDFDSVIQVDLLNETRKTISLMTKGWGFGGWLKMHENKRFMAAMAYNEDDSLTVYCLDFKTGKRKTLSKKCTKLSMWNDYYDGSSRNTFFPITVRGYYVYFYEKVAGGGSRVVRCHMGTGEKTYMTGTLKYVTDGVWARPFQNYSEYRYNDQWYRYLYKKRFTSKISEVTQGM